MTEPTKRPWEIDGTSIHQPNDDGVNFVFANVVLAQTVNGRQLNDGELEAIAKNVLRAVNAFDDLVKALEGARQGFRAMAYMTHPQVVREKSMEEAALITSAINAALSK